MESSFKGNRIWRSDRPRNIDCVDLGAIDIHVVFGENKLLILDPNVAVFLAHSVEAALRYVQENTRRKENAIDLASLPDGISNIGELPTIAGLTSIISGEPAIIYMTNEERLALTPQEMCRLISRTLTPLEFGKICQEVGAIYELHDDFYDPETGVSYKSQEKDEENQYAAKV